MFQKIINVINYINNKNNNILNVVVFVVFALLTFTIGINHEAWADEAQSWLIARDCSFYEIIFERCHYEGTPFLWFIILKIFILINWNYEFLFVISWIFSCLGIYFFIFKSNFSNIIKYFFPFTYFIFYQYTIIARSYCLIFPILCLIAIFYNKRFEKTYLYFFLLAMLASICAFSYILSFMLLLFFILDYIYVIKKEKIYLKDLFIKNSYIFVLCIYFLFIYFICKVPIDRGFKPINTLSIFNLNQVLNTFIQGYFNQSKSYIFIATIVCLFLYYFSMKTFCKTIKHKIYFSLLNLSLLISIAFLSPYVFAWHVGLLILVLIFSCWIFKNENNINFVSIEKNKIFYIVFIIICSVQICWSITTSINDINKQYDYSKYISLYIKQNNLTSKDIAYVGKYCVSIQPYFKENIWCNSDSSFEKWSEINQKKYIESTKKILDKVKIVICDQHIDMNEQNISIKNKMKEYGFKKSYEFISDMYVKGKIFQYRPRYEIYIKN